MDHCSLLCRVIRYIREGDGLRILRPMRESASAPAYNRDANMNSAQTSLWPFAGVSLTSTARPSADCPLAFKRPVVVVFGYQIVVLTM